VHLAELAAEERADLLVLAGLGERLDPERDRLQAARRVELAGALPEPRDDVAAARLSELRVECRAEGLPRGVETREVELALRGEVAVEDRLGDARRAGDLRGRGAAVAGAREDA
jgi:hypothetical protein